MIYSKADTHIHTTYSDGLMSPEETVEIIATQTDLSVIAITAPPSNPRHASVERQYHQLLAESQGAGSRCRRC